MRSICAAAGNRLRNASKEAITSCGVLRGKGRKLRPLDELFRGLFETEFCIGDECPVIETENINR
jgi:hypothetical protein